MKNYLKTLTISEELCDPHLITSFVSHCVTYHWSVSHEHHTGYHTSHALITAEWLLSARTHVWSAREQKVD